MDQAQLLTLAKLGAVAALGLAAVGSALGCGTAGMAAIGAWKKAYLKGKNALFTLLIFVGAPIAPGSRHLRWHRHDGICLVRGQVRCGRLQRPRRNRQGPRELPDGLGRRRNRRAVRHGVLHDARVVGQSVILSPGTSPG